VAILMFLCGSPRLCQLRIEGLVSVSKYWTHRSYASVYVSSKSSNLPSTNAWLKSTASLAGLGEKLRRVPRTTQPGWEVESGALFLGSSSIRPTMLTTYKRLPRTGTTHRKRTLTGVGSVYAVLVGFFCRVYINLNHCDSRIWVTACS
jgi:hypothetical protein